MELTWQCKYHKWLGMVNAYYWQEREQLNCLTGKGLKELRKSYWTGNRHLQTNLVVCL